MGAEVDIGFRNAFFLPPLLGSQFLLEDFGWRDVGVVKGCRSGFEGEEQVRIDGDWPVLR